MNINRRKESMQSDAMNGKEHSTEGYLYHIRVRGSLDDRWADRFNGFVMTTRGDGETLLTGRVRDQSALHGILTTLHNLGLPIVLVVQVNCPCSTKDCPRHGMCADCSAYEAERGKMPVCLRKKTKWDRSLVLFQGR